ncbi:MAG: alpha/beta hydrolase fold domain-containing protein [Pseudomonadota bacterium]
MSLTVPFAFVIPAEETKSCRPRAYRASALTLVLVSLLLHPVWAQVTVFEDLAYGDARPGNLLDLYVPIVDDVRPAPLLIWHSGSAWLGNEGKDADDAVQAAQRFNGRGYAVATLSIRASSDAPFPAQGYDVRAAIRFLRRNAGLYGIDPVRVGIMGNSSGGWAAAFAAATSDIPALPGETGIAGTSSAVRVAVAFFPPSDFLSMDQFAQDNDLPQGPAYPHDSPNSPEGRLILCPSEAIDDIRVSIQECPQETEAADPASYIEGVVPPLWVLHGLVDDVLPFNQSELLFQASAAWDNFAKFTLVPTAGHAVEDIIGAAQGTTTFSIRGTEFVRETGGPTWGGVDRFLATYLKRP